MHYYQPGYDNQYTLALRSVGEIVQVIDLVHLKGPNGTHIIKEILADKHLSYTIHSNNTSDEIFAHLISRKGNFYIH